MNRSARAAVAGRVVVVAVIAMALLGLFIVLGTELALGGFLLVVAVGLLGAALALDLLTRPGPLWPSTTVEDAAILHGRDARTLSHLRVLESHLAAGSPDLALRNRLAGIADDVLRTTHGAGLASDRDRALLGDEVAHLLTTSTAPLTPRTIAVCLTRLESL